MSKPLNPKQAAAKLGCSVDQLRRLADEGEIKAVNIGLGKIRQRRVFYADDIQAFIHRRSATSSATIKPRASHPIPSREWV